MPDLAEWILLNVAPGQPSAHTMAETTFDVLSFIAVAMPMCLELRERSDDFASATSKLLLQ